MMVTWAAIALYIGVFIHQVIRSQQKHWLWGSVVLWLGFGLIGARLLPGIWRGGAWLYQPYFYITLASFFFFVSAWQWQRDSRTFYALPPVTPLLSYWAVAALMQHLAYLILLLLVRWQSGGGMADFVRLALAQLYVLHPLWWMCVHAVLMLLLAATVRKQNGTPHFKVVDLQAAFLSALIMMMAYVLYNIWQFVVMWN
ncbi:MAG: hypothetical protein Q4G42_09510 [Neisseria sp.]|nr:hypothetical protein [Neisseria sp.]